MLITVLLGVLYIGILAYQYRETWQQFILSSVANYGLIAVFLLAAILDAAPQPFGGDVPMAIAIVLKINPIMAVIVAILGSTIGASISYIIGAGYNQVSKTHVCSIEKHKNACRIYEKYGKLSLLVAALSPLPYELFCWFAGVFKMKIKDYVVFGIVPRALRFIVVGLFVVWII